MAKNKNADSGQFGPEDEIQSGLFKFEKVGDELEGILIDVRTVKSKIDSSDQKMKTAKLGQLVKMIYAEEGKAKKGTNNKFKLIKVYLKNAPMSDSDEIDPDEVGR